MCSFRGTHLFFEKRQKTSLFAPFRKKVPKTFRPKLRFGEFDSIDFCFFVFLFYREGLVVCDNNTKRKG